MWGQDFFVQYNIASQMAFQYTSCEAVFLPPKKIAGAQKGAGKGRLL
jgi:hypothetical protein